MEKNALSFPALAAAMLATPLILFAIACARDSVFLVDCSGAMFGIDAVLVSWMYDRIYRAQGRKPMPLRILNNRP